MVGLGPATHGSVRSSSFLRRRTADVTEWEGSSPWVVGPSPTMTRGVEPRILLQGRPSGTPAAPSRDPSYPIPTTSASDAPACTTSPTRLPVRACARGDT